MQAMSRFFLVAGLTALFGLPVPAQAPPARTKGAVLLLENERALEGDIDLQGEQYCIRKGTGEMWVPAAKALRLFANWDEALTFLKARTNLHDPDERLRLAHWCQQNNLPEHGLAEVTVALDLRPGHAHAKQLQTLLIKALATRHSAAPAGEPAPALPPPPVIDIGAESLALFNSKVQPILLNTCASCHAHDRGGKFKLFRSHEGGQRASLQRNLAAAIAQIHPEKPHLSPLLIKAVSVHDRAAPQAPLAGGRQSVPYGTLETWVQMVVANNPHLREEFGRALPVAAAPPAASRSDFAAPPAEHGPRPLPSQVTVNAKVLEPSLGAKPGSQPLVSLRPAEPLPFEPLPGPPPPRVPGVPSGPPQSPLDGDTLRMKFAPAWGVQQPTPPASSGGNLPAPLAPVSVPSGKPEPDFGIARNQYTPVTAVPNVRTVPMDIHPTVPDPQSARPAGPSQGPASLPISGSDRGAPRVVPIEASLPVSPPAPGTPPVALPGPGPSPASREPEDCVDPAIFNQQFHPPR